mmetsp:Transcript_3751/g.10345  ORF Transcript_3751/g.10345 Transcript_3751/m.10345 type:complete len:206 (-) Transcript_3751:192-809(-)
MTVQKVRTGPIAFHWELDGKNGCSWPDAWIELDRAVGCKEERLGRLHPESLQWRTQIASCAVRPGRETTKKFLRWILSMAHSRIPSGPAVDPSLHESSWRRFLFHSKCAFLWKRLYLQRRQHWPLVPSVSRGPWVDTLRLRDLWALAISMVCHQETTTTTRDGRGWNLVAGGQSFQTFWSAMGWHSHISGHRRLERFPLVCHPKN